MEAQIRLELSRLEALRRHLVDDLNREGVRPEDMYGVKNVDGTYIMMPLILARSNLLLTLAMLKKK